MRACGTGALSYVGLSETRVRTLPPNHSPLETGQGRLLAPQPFSDIPQHPCTLEMFVLGLVFHRVGREQMLLSNLEGFVRMQIET